MQDNASNIILHDSVSEIKSNYIEDHTVKASARSVGLNMDIMIESGLNVTINNNEITSSNMFQTSNIIISNPVSNVTPLNVPNISVINIQPPAHAVSIMGMDLIAWEQKQLLRRKLRAQV